jgi:dihydrolipoamide dehydrogenase
LEILEAGKFGIDANITSIDFTFVMNRMRTAVTMGRKFLRREIMHSKNLDFYNKEAYFIGDHLLKIKSETITAKKIFIASGSRPGIPPIKGLDSIEYLTNESVLKLAQRPWSMIIIGGGYIATEYAHFFAAMGTKVTIVELGERLLANEEPEISELLRQELSKRMDIFTSTETLEVRKQRNNCVIAVRDKITGKERQIGAERIMVATGRKSNADLLRIENTGVKTDKARFIKVDDYLRTNKENIWSLGDAIGKQMFTHAGYKEAEIAWFNATHSKKMKMDFSAVPRAVFTRPQIASIGLTETEARKHHEILVGRAKYSDVVAGDTMDEKEGFAKAIVEKHTKRILGFHIIGPHASILIQEVVNVVAQKKDVGSITGSMHIFPALSEVVEAALNNIR